MSISDDLYNSLNNERVFNIIAGPCAIESEEQINKEASFLNSMGIKFLRGGTFKARTAPESFQGLAADGVRMLSRVGNSFNMHTISEAQDTSQLEILVQHLDIIQVGARSMHNYALLEAIGRTDKPVILKRGFGSTVTEWINAANYIHRQGNSRIIMCERGIRTFSDSSRFTLDLAAVIRVRELTPWPVIVDPSHAAGIKNMVIPLAMASRAAGADGLMVEVHHDPENAMSDGAQSLNHNDFKTLIDRLNLINDNRQIY
ncbi:3-deoxy-7-phosphoheptulonate synthase [Myxococcota bacterium]|nr:3-deoxy-7-phosphoheptulonate synthase [Myxococcota bacterium]MBU1381152.1 3-deoxy-7-phosphoheptulonate synthase [Myxococcota bacterium]MBU1496724.1 3-deoxy-7-phosphoheptulonate synthase [Myxococcota bacterium]